MNEIFLSAGYRVLQSGEVLGDLQKPDGEFLRAQLDLRADWESRVLMSWRIVWGIYHA